jgi:hypothetical protein
MLTEKTKLWHNKIGCFQFIGYHHILWETKHLLVLGLSSYSEEVITHCPKLYTTKKHSPSIVLYPFPFFSESNANTQVAIDHVYGVEGPAAE